jgi:hypothetical protein
VSEVAEIGRVEASDGGGNNSAVGGKTLACISNQSLKKEESRG